VDETLAALLQHVAQSDAAFLPDSPSR